MSRNLLICSSFISVRRSNQFCFSCSVSIDLDSNISMTRSLIVSRCVGLMRIFFAFSRKFSGRYFFMSIVVLVLVMIVYGVK